MGLFADPKLFWEKLKGDALTLWRTKVPGGWFVAINGNGFGLTFYPDPDHTWDGSSLS